MEDSLVMRRPKRSTAGNRMEAALAEFKVEDVGVDGEEDIDFIVDKDEEDAFESDFESTDEEAAQEDVDASAEKLARDDERVHRKTGGMTQLDRITAAAQKRHEAILDPEKYEAIAQKKKAATEARLKRKVSMGVAVDAETGEVIPGAPSENGEGEAGEDESRRRSKRKHTVDSRTAHIERLRKEVEEKKTATPKKVKAKGPPPTQEELMKRAMDMEAGNVEEHTNYLTNEEERRRKARRIREAVDGPLLRWVSKAEKVKVIVEAPAPAPPPPAPPAPTLIRPASSGGHPTTMSYQYGYSYPNMPSSSTPASQPHTPYSPSSYYPYALVQSPHPSAPGTPPTSSQPTFIYHYPAQPAPQAPVPASGPAAATVPPPPPVHRMETVAKSYIVHELDQEDDPPKPTWGETMTAMFGNHVNWEEMEYFFGKNRPMSRPVLTCPITGEPAPYLDPRTGVPFANVHAYKTLTALLDHVFIWDETLGCYTGRADEQAENIQEEVVEPVAAASTSRKRGAKQGGAS
ncbi:hypothetical protein EIP91_005999 [Steccherinum ochraceum]|uniref:Vps72/YL1 C-terminal domain-containing protein n=1 Tax=Steccherinum ochraceum TaxID=92696 RepID=A0A4R0RCB9_9APHY|nr:hypothetical protein EIP91_005999 [Steccherinum ochraceum]